MKEEKNVCENPLSPLNSGASVTSAGHLSKPLGISAGLDEYQVPLDRRRAAHLLRRTSYLGTAVEVSTIVGLQAGELIDEMILSARVEPIPREPDWRDNLPPPRSAPSSVRQQYNRDNNTWKAAYRLEWIGELARLGLREKMALFWHDHFVTEIGTYRYAIFSHQYLKMLRTNALEYFKAFVTRVGTDPSMLIYLNGDHNLVDRPNENYARELLELFTMSPNDPSGAANYTEDDVKEIARALTGWVVSAETGKAEFVVERFDEEPKTIFEQTDSFDHNAVLDLIFAERKEAIAHYIASKLYTLFVYDVPDESIVSGLAAQLASTDFVIHDAVRTLLKSEHFFDDAVIGTKIKSPVEFVLQLVKSLGREMSEDLLEGVDDALHALGQNLFHPPDVSGWPGYRSWITTNSMPLRSAIIDQILAATSLDQPLDLIPMAEDLQDPDDPHAAFLLPTAIAEHFLAVNLEHVDVPIISDEFAGNLVQFPIPDVLLSGPPHVQNLAKIFLGGTPWYEWYLYYPQANQRLIAFVQHVLQYPDYQLM